MEIVNRNKKEESEKGIGKRVVGKERETEEVR